MLEFIHGETVKEMHATAKARRKPPPPVVDVDAFRLAHGASLLRQMSGHAITVKPIAAPRSDAPSYT